MAAWEVSRSSMLGALINIKQLGFQPQTIIDVGAALGTFPLYQVFPKARHLLIEPIKENEPYLNKICQNLEQAEYIIAAANKKSGIVNLEVNLTNYIHSSICDGSELSSDIFELRNIPAITVDEICKNKHLKPPYLIKIDVDGKELDVLAGATQILQETEYVIIEVTLFDHMYEVMNFMKAQGFITYDIVDLLHRRSDKALCQVDMAFVKESGQFKKETRYAVGEEQEAALKESLKAYKENLINYIENLTPEYFYSSLEVAKPEDIYLYAKQYLIQGDTRQVARIYEEAIARDPDTKSHYWYWGLILLLGDRDAEAQATWLLAMTEGNPAQVDIWMADLLQVLETEAQRQEQLNEYAVAWKIRQHIREINPQDINNLLHLVALSIQRGTYTSEELVSLQVIEVLSSEPLVVVNSELLIKTLQMILSCPPFSSSSVEFAEACLAFVKDPEIFVEIIGLAAVKIAYSDQEPEVAIRLIQLCQRLETNNQKSLTQLRILQQFSSLCQTLRH